MYYAITTEQENHLNICTIPDLGMAYTVPAKLVLAWELRMLPCIALWGCYLAFVASCGFHCLAGTGQGGCCLHESGSGRVFCNKLVSVYYAMVAWRDTEGVHSANGAGKTAQCKHRTSHASKIMR